MTGDAGWADARAAAFAAASALPTTLVSVLDCVGRTLVSDVRALQDVPHFASSAMDGWAVSGAGPWLLAKTAQAFTSTIEDSPAQSIAAPIVTGGVIPTGAFAVLRTEHGEVSGDYLHAVEGVGQPLPGRDIRGPAREATSNDVLIRAGVRLNPAHAAIAAGGGHDTVEVNGVPRVAVITTGAEVVASGVPAVGFVRDSFGPMLPSVIAGFPAGARVVSRQRFDDDRTTLLDAVMGADTDVVVTTGGTANSPVDHIRSVLRELDATAIVDGIDVRPGSPSTLARLPDGRFVVALPGNPLAAMMGVLLLLEPLLAALAGHPIAELDAVVAGESHEPGRVRLMPYRLVEGRALASGWRDSSMLRGLAEADGVMVVEAEGCSGGSATTVLRLPWATTS